MGKTKADWVVAGGRAGESAHCTRCGEGLTIATPQRVQTMLGAWNGFIRAHAHCRPGEWQEPTPKTPLEWVQSRDTGVSSGTIYAATTGGVTPYHAHDVPHDPDDFGRCYRFLKLFPELRPRLHKTVRLCPNWKPFVGHWDELTALYEEELPTGNAPKLYARIQELDD